MEGGRGGLGEVVGVGREQVGAVEGLLESTDSGKNTAGLRRSIVTVIGLSRFRIMKVLSERSRTG